MATTPTQAHSLFTLPFNHATDFTQLADNCERFTDALIECEEPIQKMALYGRLSACLALLQPTLLDAIPEHLKASLTVEELPSRVPAFEPECDQLGRYCQEITQLLMNGSLPRQSEIVMEDLLCELVSYFTDTLKAPRWLQTDEGTIAIG
ncbi:hypothetical protein ITR15_13330 [Enterobacter chengduensis]|uniref:Uncharacterized protein n=1 Tax=Enterobacter chengduensis TaxID=2494701 RepID=A0AAW3HJ09_9ENTR|nr:hypothetical protein [Enterobacter chengduensis]KDF40147.1 hypothetical protein AE07_04284 [Enterobacter cloacae BWH 43]OTW36959.1 hypothetical protein CAP57_00155 [Enterobacter kobei]GJL40076.1 hypothetical protein TUM17577_12850 [Enterobacter asburiae]KJX37514.1 hypothetical protein SG71_07085 [Enterobacter chengduensis]MBN9878905.1 hypothetical protein [Enterobacter chengduensis]